MRFLSPRHSQIGAYLLIVLMGAVGFQALNAQSDGRVKDRKAQTRALCHVSQVDHQALRSNAIATATLGITLVNTPPPPTDPKLVARRDYAIKVITSYRDAQLKALPPISCDKDGNVIEGK